MKILWALVTALGLSATLAAQAPASAPPPDTRPSFADWLEGVRQEALARGIKPEIVNEALGEVQEPLPVVIARDRAQAELVLPLETYITRQLTTARVRTGRQMFTTHKATLDRIAARYGVPAKIIAGVWGLESNFGRFSGVRPTITALATLAWDPRRATFFRQELFHALEILNRGDITLPRMRGSWAGAMGQPQFMPSSYLEFAVDFDENGSRDIWTSTPDVLASIANYLKGKGWVEGQLWGREVKVSKEVAATIATTVARRDGSCQATRDMSVALPLSEWQHLGVRTTAGGNLPAQSLNASLVSGNSRHFLTYQNYDALLQYNCAHAYALSVALLADQIAAAPAPRRPAPAQPARAPAARRTIAK